MNNKKSSSSTGILLLICGSIFTALGVAIVVIIIKGLIQYGIGIISIGIIMPILLISALLGFGITILIMGGKKIYLRLKQNQTYNKGTIITAQLIDYKSANFGKRTNTCIRYALVLSYNDEGENKTFTTDYLFDINEFNHLKKLKNIKVKLYNNFVIVNEQFSEDIYKVDSVYGIETEFYKKKPVALLMRLWRIFFVFSIIFLVASFIIKDSTVTTIAIITIFTIHFPFVIPLAIYLIKWITRKNKTH